MYVDSASREYLSVPKRSFFNRWLLCFVLDSQEVDEQLIAEVVEKCSSETCSRPSENEVSQQPVEFYSVRDFKEEPERDISKISAVRPFSIETKNCTDISAPLGTEAVYGCVTAPSGSALPSSPPEAIQEKAMTESTMGVTLEASTETNLKSGDLLSECPAEAS